MVSPCLTVDVLDAQNTNYLHVAHTFEHYEQPSWKLWYDRESLCRLF